MNKTYLGLGANLGDRQETINQALDRLDCHDSIVVKKVSRFSETTPVLRLSQPASQPNYLNGVCHIETTLLPHDLLGVTQEIERHLGRKTKGDGASRMIDIDILLVDQWCCCDEVLTIPHPRMYERAFVLGPLSEIAPALNHPLLNVTIQSLLAQCVLV